MAVRSLLTVSDELAGAGLCAEVSNRTNSYLCTLAPAFRYQNMKSQQIVLSRIDANASVLTVSGRNYIVERCEYRKGFVAWAGQWRQESDTRSAAIAACVFHALNVKPVPHSPASVARFNVEVRAA